MYKGTIKAIKKSPRVLLATSLALSGTLGIQTIARETYESTQGPNYLRTIEVPGVGAVIYKNTDTRAFEKLYNDALDAALNAEGMENVLTNGSTMSREEKLEFCNNFTNSIAEEMGIEFNGIITHDSSTAGGYYIGFNPTKKIAYTDGYLHLHEDVLASSLISVLSTIFHETVHATHGQNLETSDNLSDLDKELFTQRDLVEFEGRDYYARPSEVTAHLLTNKFMDSFYKKYAPEINYNYLGTVSNLLEEVFDRHEGDGTLNKNMTLKEIYDANTIDFLKQAGYNPDEVNLDDTYLTDFFYFVVPAGYENVRFVDFKTDTYQKDERMVLDQIGDLDNDIQNFASGNYSKIPDEAYDDYGMDEEDLIKMAEYTIARKVAELIAQWRYYGLDGTSDTTKLPDTSGGLTTIEQELILSTVADYMEYVPERYITYFGLENMLDYANEINANVEVNLPDEGMEP